MSERRHWAQGGFAPGDTYPAKDLPVFIYAAWCRAEDNRDGCNVKIGVSSNPARRIMHLQVHNPAEVRMLFLSEGMSRDHALEQERIIHQRLRDRRIRNEWFRISHRDALLVLAEIKYDGYESMFEQQKHEKLRELFATM